MSMFVGGGFRKDSTMSQPDPSAAEEQKMALPGPCWKQKYAHPRTQIIILGVICLLLPGMFNAINGLGAVGKADATITDNANTALAVTFAVCSILAGGLFNLVGHRVLLFLGGLTYILYIGSYLSYNAVFVISSGTVLGVGAGFLWTAQGAIVMSYPEEKNKGLYISIFWAIFNCGAILGSVVSLAIEWHNDVSHITNTTYIAFMVTMGVGCVLTLLLLPPTQIQRADGSQVAEVRPVKVSTEAIAILKLFQDKRMLCLMPMFFVSNWFYTYQFNAVNGGGMFTTRTRGMNGTFYWFAQVLGSFLMGRLLDYKHAERRKRAICGLGVLFVATMVIWGGGYAFQETFSRTDHNSVKPRTGKIDLADSRRYAGPVVLYALYGLFDALWQTYCYWIMGALSNQTDEAARMSGLYKAIQNAGAACSGQVDALKVSYKWELLINWILLIVGNLFAFPVAMSLQNSLQAPVSEEAKGVEGSGDDPAQ